MVQKISRNERTYGNSNFSCKFLRGVKLWPPALESEPMNAHYYKYGKIALKKALHAN